MSVTVQVLVHDVARLYELTRISLTELRDVALLDLLIARIKALGDISPLREHIVATLVKPRIGRVCLSILNHLVVVLGHIAANRKPQVLIECMAVFKACLEAGILHDTHIGRNSFCETCNKRHVLARHEDIRAALVEEIKYKRQVVLEEVDLYAEVALMDLRPLCLIAIIVIIHGSRGAIASPIGRIIVIFVGEANLREIGKAAA